MLQHAYMTACCCHAHELLHCLHTELILQAAEVLALLSSSESCHSYCWVSQVGCKVQCVDHLACGCWAAELLLQLLQPLAAGAFLAGTLGLQAHKHKAQA